MDVREFMAKGNGRAEQRGQHTQEETDGEEETDDTKTAG